jgi:hypothetical protein
MHSIVRAYEGSLPLYGKLDFMAVDENLSAFIRAAKAHGVEDAFVADLLSHQGWTSRRIYEAFAEYYSTVLGTGLPTRVQTSENARDAFFYLLNFITLGFWTVALGQIWYALVANWFPDAAERGSYAASVLFEDLSWQVATVIVTFPIFLFVHSRIQRSLAQRPDLYDSGVRKWLTYLALVLAAVIVTGDAVWFLNALLRGEITVRFVLDSLCLLVLGGGVFTYYLLTIDRPKTQE